MINMDKKYQTRNGKPVTLVTVSGRGNYPVFGYVGDDENITRWSATGGSNHYFPGYLDLVEVETPKKTILWINIVEGNKWAYLACTSLETAKDISVRNAQERFNHIPEKTTARIKIEIEGDIEGRFDE